MGGCFSIVRKLIALGIAVFLLAGLYAMVTGYDPQHLTRSVTNIIIIVIIAGGGLWLAAELFASPGDPGENIPAEKMEPGSVWTVKGTALVLIAAFMLFAAFMTNEASKHWQGGQWQNNAVLSVIIIGGIAIGAIVAAVRMMFKGPGEDTGLSSPALWFILPILAVGVCVGSFYLMVYSPR